MGVVRIWCIEATKCWIGLESLCWLEDTEEIRTDECEGKLALLLNERSRGKIGCNRWSIHRGMERRGELLPWGAKCQLGTL